MKVSRFGGESLLYIESLSPPIAFHLTPLEAQFIPGSTHLTTDSVQGEKGRRRMEGGRKVVLSGERKYSSRRLIPRRGQVKASIVIGLAQSLAALFSLAVARLA
ncbi:unnamed protein product [Musa acuminata subsp. malaccensis]|uniref:(wild Malaysian banana) hypothetical protein n=1 Tax=Musa acuminata subsp. malaccensis TaxID=214687 RepID=A0A804LBG9_MUSAM|nr:unnamed protein product [Musa acuminata subsp. malaccensis]